MAVLLNLWGPTITKFFCLSTFSDSMLMPFLVGSSRPGTFSFHTLDTSCKRHIFSRNLSPPRLGFSFICVSVLSSAPAPCPPPPGIYGRRKGRIPYLDCLLYFPVPSQLSLRKTTVLTRHPEVVVRMTWEDPYEVSRVVPACVQRILTSSSLFVYPLSLVSVSFLRPESLSYLPGWHAVGIEWVYFIR